MTMNVQLMQATEKGDLEEVKRLLQEGASVAYQDERGRTPLMSATQQNNIPLAEVLIDAGSDVNQRDAMLLTPWICAAANGFFEILRYGAPHADVALTNRFGGTALLPSSEKGFLKAVDVAIQAGVPVNHINDLGWTGLQEAVVLGDGGSLYSLVIRLLMNHGADPTTLDHDGKTAIDWAKEYNQDHIVAILEGTYDKHSNEEQAIAEVMAAISADDFEEATDKANKAWKEQGNLIFAFLKGYSLVLQKEYDKGIAVYEEALEDGKNPEFYFYIANALREQKKVDEAIATYRKAIASYEENFYFRYHLSNYLRELGKHEDAIREMDILLEQNPDRYDYLFHKANSLRVLGNNEEADRILAEYKKEGSRG